LELFARRNWTSFEKMMVQEMSENISSKPIAARVTGSELFTSSQKFTSARRLPKFAEVNRFPFSFLTYERWRCVDVSSLL
jgi:hypothetical protein